MRTRLSKLCEPAGGVVCNCELFQRELMNHLDKLEPPPGNVRMVDEPVMGCLIIGRKKLIS